MVIKPTIYSSDLERYSVCIYIGSDCATINALLGLSANNKSIKLSGVCRTLEECVEKAMDGIKGEGGDVLNVKAMQGHDPYAKPIYW